jgi:hypothetical protein
MTSEQRKARVQTLALRRGFAAFRAPRSLYIADARGLPRIESDSIIYLVDVHGVQRELCRAKTSALAWQAALDILELSAK